MSTRVPDHSPALTRAQFIDSAMGAAAALVLGLTGSPALALEEHMHTRPIPSAQEPLPVIGCGAWQTFDVGPSPDERASLAEVLRTRPCCTDRRADTVVLPSPGFR